MPLSHHMEAMLLRMSRREWLLRPQWPSGGRRQQGWLRTLQALQRRGLVKYLGEGEHGRTLGIEVTGPGWVLTVEGTAVAEKLTPR